jgi:hypothetical protein
MKDLTILTNTQLGEFISLSLVHGTNTQFSYELLHEVAERLVQTDEIIKAGVNYALKNQDVGTIKPLSFTLDEVAQALDEVLAANVDEDNDETKEVVEIITDLMAHEAMNKAMKVDRDEGRAGLSSAKKTVIEQPVEEVKPKATKKKEKPVETPVEVEVLPETEKSVEPVELTAEPETPALTAKMLKEVALELRQRNAISKEQIVDKLTELDASSTMTLAPKHYAEFYNFLESFNV